MSRFRFNLRSTFMLASAIACLALLAAGFFLASRDFGVGGAVGLSLPLVLPLLVAIRFVCRSPAVSNREIAYLATAFCIACGVAVFAANEWYDAGFDDRHTEDVQWSRFESEFRRDPAFRFLKVEWNHKSRYYVIGELTSEAEFERLRNLSVQHGVRWPLDGPWAHSKSLTVTQWSQDLRPTVELPDGWSAERSPPSAN